MLRPSPPGRVARLRYGSPDVTVISPGDHVVCAVSGVAIPLDQLRYWSVARQEPYATAAISAARHAAPLPPR